MAKIRSIIIEGDMTPAELREFADAFWNNPTPNTQRAVATTSVDMRQHTVEEIKAAQPAPPVEPAPSAPAPAPVVEAAPAQDDRMTRLLGAKRMNELLAMLQEEGFTTLDQMMAECRKLQPHHPGLRKLGEGLEDRITRTWEGMQ